MNIEEFSNILALLVRFYTSTQLGKRLFTTQDIVSNNDNTWHSIHF